jgi:endoglucanase Acf2
MSLFWVGRIVAVRTLLILGAIVALAPLAFGAEAVVAVGAGGYRTSPTKFCKPLPAKIYKTSDLEGPMLTNQWWSSLVWQPHSQNMFPHPLAVRCTPQGLNVEYPGQHIHGNETGIFGTSAKDGDLTLGLSGVDAFPDARCGGYSDWFVTSVFAAGDAEMRASFGHGSPFVFATYHGGDPVVSFSRPPQVWSGDATSAVLGVTVNGHHYGLFGATGSTWNGLDGLRFTNRADGQPYVSLALLPDDQPQTLKLFTRYAYNHVTDTRLEFQVADGQVTSSYRYTTKPYEGDETGTLFALYPHQWKYATSKLSDLTYGSVRGLMKLGAGDAFTVAIPVQGFLPMLPAQGIGDRERLLGYLKAEAAAPPPGFADTYFEGKYLGRLVTLSGIAEVADAPELQQQFVTELKRRLEAWFTATADKEEPVFYYDSAWGTLIGSKPSFGSDNPLNDHHFHYGYFIRGAAEVARLDPKWAKEWGPMVNLVIRDIASPDRADKQFPYLRCFDKYAGHSWASGDANFADGNNQESSSESMNAWYGVALWGEATGDFALRDLGVSLFNTERTAVEEYWFDVSGTNYPQDFPQVALGMVWGGKGAFGTWFSGDIDCIHGINWLPFTPASIYMGRHPDYVQKNHDRIVAKRPGGRDYNNGWGDLVVMFGALHDPASALKYINAKPNCKVEAGNTRAFMYHWITTLDTFGRNDTGVTADYPFHMVLQKDGTRMYAIYNFRDEPLRVTFSDGMVLKSTQRGLEVVTKY